MRNRRAVGTARPRSVERMIYWGPWILPDVFCPLVDALFAFAGNRLLPQNSMNAILSRRRFICSIVAEIGLFSACVITICTPRRLPSPEDHQAFLGRGVPRGQHELMLGDDGDDLFGFRAAALRSSTRTRTVGSPLPPLSFAAFSASKVDIQTSRPQPPAIWVMCSTARGIHAALRQIQVDAASFDSGTTLRTSETWSAVWS